MRGIKRNMGSDFKFPIDDKTYTPEEISAVILRKLKEDAEAFLGETVTDAVITVPAYFGPPERTATQKAAELIGLTVRALLAEPIAAAVDYAEVQGEKLADKTVMVFDLGGGTFDATLMRVTRKTGADKTLEVRILDKDGSISLGGLNWDQALCDHVAKSFQEKHGKDPYQDPPTRERLLLECQLPRKP